MVDISRYRAGLQLVPKSSTAPFIDESGMLVAMGDSEVDDEMVFGLIGSGRR